MNKYNILIVEDHPFTKQTLVYELKQCENINILGALENGKEAVDFVKTQTPDIILMDIDMPVMNGIDATLNIKQFNNNIKVIILTAHNEKEKVLSSFQSGANAYCVKNIDTKELLRIMDIVSDGGIWFDTQIAHFIFDILKNIEENKQNELNKKAEDFNITERERNVIKLVADGLSNTEIANELVISTNTVKNHIASIIKKLSVKDRTQIAIYALKNNILS